MMQFNILPQPLFLLLLSSAVSGTPTPENTQPGIIATCNKWHTAPAGDTCYDTEALANITHDQFLAWNPVLSAGCPKMFWAGYEYCVGVEDSSSLSSLTVASAMSMTTTAQHSYATSPEPMSSTSLGSGSASGGNRRASLTPGLTQTLLRIVNHPTATLAPVPCSTSTSASGTDTLICTAYHVAAADDSCATVEKQYSISHALFLEMNPRVSGDCERGFWAGEEFCVGVEGGGGRGDGGTSSARGGVSSGGGNSSGGVLIVPVATGATTTTASVGGRWE